MDSVMDALDFTRENVHENRTNQGTAMKMLEMEL